MYGITKNCRSFYYYSLILFVVAGGAFLISISSEFHSFDDETPSLLANIIIVGEWYMRTLATHNRSPGGEIN